MQQAGLAGLETRILQHTFIAASMKPLIPDRRKHAAQYHDIWHRLGEQKT